MNLIGIDPGSVSAAYAILDSETGEILDVDDVPVADKMIDTAEFFRRVMAWDPKVGIIENVHAFPGQGVRSVFRFGMGFGILHAVLTCAGVSLHEASPTKWKKFYGLDSNAEKSRALAIKFWPGCQKLSRRKDHGRAEALLMARYLRETTNLKTGKFLPGLEA